MQRARALRVGIVSLTLFITAAVVAASQPATIAPDDLGAWSLHCFCIEATSTPQRIIRMDTNGRLLHRAVGGASVAAIRASGLPVSDSQLAVLRAYRLITQDGDRVTTAFPVIGPDDVAKMRVASRRLGQSIAIQIRPDVRAIKRELARDGWTESDYAVVFGYALDGLLWDHLRRTGALPETALSAQVPFWRGAFWAVYPKRIGGAGRNEITNGTTKLVAVWTDPASDRINQFLKSQVAAETLERHAGSPDAKPAHRSDKTQTSVPIIMAAKGSAIHDISERIAASTVEALNRSEAGAALRRTVPKTFEREAVVIVAHELIWDVAAALVDDGDLTVPKVLTAGQANARLESAMFIVSGAKPDRPVRNNREQGPNPRR
jgi:hypothetical protein